MDRCGISMAVQVLLACPDGCRMEDLWSCPWQGMTGIDTDAVMSVSFPGGGAERLTNDLTDYGARIELTTDASKAVFLSGRGVSHIWLLPGGDSAKAKQITSGETQEGSVAAGPNGKILVNRSGGLVLMNPDGSQPRSFSPDHAGSDFVSSCDDKYVVLVHQASTMNSGDLMPTARTA